MKSLRELYKIGVGPSSSHTMGPHLAATVFQKENPDADNYRVILYGSLALTGQGHLTDKAVMSVLGEKKTEVIFDTKKTDLLHPNTLVFQAFKDNAKTAEMTVYSVGGGSIKIDGWPSFEPPEVYPHNTFAEIRHWCEENHKRISDYVLEFEGKDIIEYLLYCWNTMKTAIADGLEATGTLPGKLEVQRKAKYLYSQRHIDESPQTSENRLVCAYGFAVAEQNAAAGTIVTAPTCGSCGVIPAALKYIQDTKHFTDEEIVRGLAVGGIIGNLIKHNASISGAECGCQAEIGTACSMCAAALAEIHGLSLSQIEYAAEVAMEHHLGLTCDPIYGLVQIPCIERNAVAAMRALNALSLANFLSDTRRISFDLIVRTMYETGKDLGHGYRETAEGGLAKYYPAQ